MIVYNNNLVLLYFDINLNIFNNYFIVKTI